MVRGEFTRFRCKHIVFNARHRHSAQNAAADSQSTTVARQPAAFASTDEPAATNAAPRGVGRRHYRPNTHKSLRLVEAPGKHRTVVAARVARRKRTSSQPASRLAAVAGDRHCGIDAHEARERFRRVCSPRRLAANVAREDFDHIFEHVLVVFNCAEHVDATTPACGQGGVEHVPKPNLAKARWTRAPSRGRGCRHSCVRRGGRGRCCAPRVACRGLQRRAARASSGRIVCNEELDGRKSEWCWLVQRRIDHECSGVSQRRQATR